MTFEYFAAFVRDWQGRLTPAEVRSCVEGLLVGSVDGLPRGTTVDAALAMVAKGEPVLVPDGKAEPEAAPVPRRQGSKARGSRASKARASQGLRGRPSKRAQALVCEQLANGPKRGEEVQAAAHLADISERTLIAAASALGVPTQRGQVVAGAAGFVICP